MRNYENCTCKKKRCERHGNCDECRKHHAEMKHQRPVACEKRKKLKKAVLQFHSGLSKEMNSNNTD